MVKALEVFDCCEEKRGRNNPDIVLRALALIGMCKSPPVSCLIVVIVFELSDLVANQWAVLEVLLEFH